MEQAKDKKKTIHAKEREVWATHIGQNIGMEINGKERNFTRPLVVLKTFNYLPLF